MATNFHPECFACAYCNKIFANSPFYLEDGLPYCEEGEKSLGVLHLFNSWNCWHCTSWHYLKAEKYSEFLLTSCNISNNWKVQTTPLKLFKLFILSSFGPKTSSIKPFKPIWNLFIDWNELFTTKCVSCGFPIEAGDRWVEALNNNYHSQCFNCSVRWPNCRIKNGGKLLDQSYHRISSAV